MGRISSVLGVCCSRSAVDVSVRTHHNVQEHLDGHGTIPPGQVVRLDVPDDLGRDGSLGSEQQRRVEEEGGEEDAEEDARGADCHTGEH